jgi:hypothetical protein
VVSSLFFCCIIRKYLLDSDSITSFGSKIKELLDHTLVAVRVFAQRVDNPKLAKVDSSSDSGRFGVPGDKLDILDTATLVRLDRTQKGLPLS